MDENNENNEWTFLQLAGVIFAVMVPVIALVIQMRKDCEREASAQQTKELEKKSCPERRKRAISKLIRTEKVASDRNDKCRFDTSCFVINECPICLDTFKKDQPLSQSREGKCNHRFHEYCLIPWLLKHDDCPCCRMKIIDESTLLEDDIEKV